MSDLSVIIKQKTMRFYFIIFFLTFFKVNGQVPEFYCKQPGDIALIERMHHQRMNNATNQTGASANFDVKYYRCEWEVDPSIRYIKGKVTIYYSITRATNSITLDLMSSLNVDSVKQRNSLLINQQNNDLLIINYPSIINSGILDSVSIYYKGIPANTGFGSFIQDQHNGIPVMWSLSEPYGARDWWPCRNGLDDKADSIDIMVTHPAQFKAAANGILQGETVLPGGTKKLTWWKHRYPIATYLICFAVTNYTTFNNTVQLGSVVMPMQTFCYPENLAAFQTGTQNVLDALQLYNATFGEYPFIKEKYGHVQFGWGGGMEHQTSTFIVSPDEGLIAHELAHQWFGDKITCGSWVDIWLNEGFATNIASFYAENKYPAYKIANRKNDINYITSLSGGSVKVDDTTDVNRIFDYRLSYLKGSHVLYMLRFMLGDSLYFRALRRYQRDAAITYGFAFTDDLRRSFEQESGLDLTHFFDQWYAGQGFPTYHVLWSSLGGGFVKIRMNQTTSHTSVPFFELPVALQFKNATKQKTVIVNNKANGEIFIRDIGFEPDTVLIDPEYWLITRNNTADKVADNITGMNVIQVFPNPIQSQFYIYLSNFTTPAATINLYNTIGQLVYTNTILFQNGSAFIEVPSNHLASGVYMLKIKAGNEVNFVKKLLK